MIGGEHRDGVKLNPQVFNKYNLSLTYLVLVPRSQERQQELVLYNKLGLMVMSFETKEGWYKQMTQQIKAM